MAKPSSKHSRSEPSSITSTFLSRKHAPSPEKRHSSDSITPNSQKTPRSNAIPRGNGNQAMSIPMPPPSLYFSLLPSSSNSGSGSRGSANIGSLGAAHSDHHSSRYNSSSTNRSNSSIDKQSDKASTSTDHSQISSMSSKHHRSTPALPPTLTFTPFQKSNAQNNSNNNSGGHPVSKASPNSRSPSNPSTPEIGSSSQGGVGGTLILPTTVGGINGGGNNHYHTHHYAPRSAYPLSMTHSRRSSLSHTYIPGSNPERQKQGFFDMSIFDPAPEHLPRSSRTSVDHDRHSHRVAASRPPSIESINSANSVPFAPLPPPPPSAWKRFTNHFSNRVIKRHIKFIIALYLSSAFTLIPQAANFLGNVPYLANVAVIFLHPARTVGSQLEVTLFSVIGGVLAAIWILPCQAAVAAFNQKYLKVGEGNSAAWVINAAWLFIGVWIMTTYKAKYAKLNCSFIIYTIAGIFALTRNHVSTQFNFHDFWDLMGPMMLGTAICLVVSILFWPETASEGLGRALNESMDSSRNLLNLSTRSFLLNHKTIALPKSVVEKAQSEVRNAQKKLFNAYKEARYEVTYSSTDPADYKEVRLIVSALMRHLASMSLVVQNERLLMLGHPDRDDEDLMSVAESNDMEDSSSSESESGSGSESENESDTNNNSGSVEKIHQQSEYFGCDTAEATVKRGSSRRRRHSRKKDNPSNSPSSEEGCRTPQKRVQRRSSAAELRRVRQLLQRAENTTQAVIKARQQQQERLQKEALQQSFLFDRGGIATAPSSPGGRGVRSVFGHHQAHRSKRFSSSPSEPNEHTDDYFRQFGSNSTTPNSSRPNSIHEEQNLETVKSFKSLFSVRSGPKFKPRRSSSLKAECKQGNRKELRDSSGAGNSVHASPSSRTSIDEAHYATLPARLGGAVFEDGSPNQRHSPHSGLKFKAPLSEYQMKKAAEAYRKQREKEARREHKRAEKEAKIEQQLLESQRQAEAAARAIPPKEVAFGDRKLFMSFLNIVRDPLQRLSDTCSRVMFSLERELVAGLNVEQDRLERIKRRNAQHAAAIRATEAILAEEEKAAAIGATADAKTADPANNEAVGIEKSGSDVINKKADSKTRILDRIRTLIGIDTPHLTKDDIDYVKALKSGMNMNKEKNTKLPKKVPIDTPHPNKFLQKDAQRNAAFSGLDDEDDLALPPGVSYVQYLTQELEIFDKAEAESLRDFISTHPTLEVGPREELFLIFFFLFALREIARELLRLGKYLEEQEEKVRARMETEHHIKRRKKLWWPKVVGNFWRWFAWGNYNQVKTSEGYNSLILNSAKNLEHRQLMSVEEEKAHVEAKAAKAAAEKAAAEAAAKAALERQAAAHRRRHSETWNLQPLRRRATVSALVHRGRQSPDVEKGLGSESYATEAHPQRPSLREKSHEPRSRSASPIHSSSGKYRHEHRQHARAGHQPFSRALKKPKSEVGLEDPNVLGVKEVLNRDFGEDDVASPSGATLEAPLTDIKNKSSLAEQYTVVEIPDYESLRHKDDKELKHFEDVNLVELSPRVNTLKPRSTAPPELVTDEATKPKKPVQVIERPSMSHQDRYPSFASSTSPALLHAPDSTTIDSSDAQARCGNPRRSTGDSGDNDSSSTNDRFSRERHYHDHQNKDEQRRSRGIFATFSRRPSEDALELASKERQGPRQAASENEPEKPSGTVFVSVKKPKTLRYRLWELLQPFNSAEYKFGFKMAVALTFIGLWSWLEWNNKPLATDRGQWAMMTVMAVLSPTIGATFSVCAMRVAGTLVGTLWALLTFLALPRNPYVICAMMLIVAFAGAFFILETSQPQLGIIMLLSYSSITFIMYGYRSSETIFEVCYKRAITVIVGIIVSVAMNTLLWPILARRELRKEIAVLIGRQGVLFAELVNKFLLEDPKARRPNHMASWSHYNRHHQGDQEGYNNDGLDERRDPLQDSFIERAERESMNKRQQQARQGDTKPTRNQNLGNDAVSDREGLLYQDEDSRNTMDPDRIAFQHVEQQLQTKLIKISQLLELSALEPRLKEEFPMKLYQQIVQCCQNILDRMVSMRMAAQMLSPEVRELVTGPMNYYRRDMVGALLLYFSVLSSSLAAKSPLPPYLPSARMARLRVIYNVREAIAANRVVTGEDHYTYIYYYAFSSALEEVIEELELLAILIKPLVGVTLVSSGACYTPGTLGDQLNLGSAVATNQLGLPPIPSGATQDAMAQNTAMTPSTMVNIGAADATTAGMGANAFGQPLQYPQDPLYQQQRALEQQQAQQQHRQLQLQLQVHAQHQQIQQQQQQILLQQQQLSMNFHPDLAIPAPSRILINPQIIPVRIAAMNSGDVENPSLNRSDSSSTPSESSEDSHQRPRDETDQRVATRETASVVPGKEPKSKSKSFKAKTGNIHVDISPTTSGTTSISHNLNDLLIPNTTTASALGAPGIIVMDESLLGNRHAQRYKDAVQAAQEASGQQVIEVSSPTLAMFPAQIQLPMCTLSTESYGNGIQRKRSTTTGGIRPSALATGSFKGTDGSGLQSRTKRPSLVPYDSHNSGKSHHHLHPHHPHHGKDHDSSNAHKKDSPSPSAASMITTASPYIPTVTTAIVMPFEYERAPEPVLPLHMIPTLAQSQARQEGQEGQEGQQQQQRQQHD